MRRNTRSSVESNRHSSLFVLSFLCVFLCAAALGTLRLYGLYLEHRISETSGRIEACRKKTSRFRAATRSSFPPRGYTATPARTLG